MSQERPQDKSNNNSNKNDKDTVVESTTSTTASSSSHSAVPIPFVSFILTGFGPFGGVPDNPTSIIVNGMKEYLTCSSSSSKINRDDNDDNRSENWKKELLPHLQHCLVLETSAHAVKEAFHDNDDDNDGGRGEIANLVRENLTKTTTTTRTTTSKHSTTTPIITVLLHLGVNYQGTQIQLEECSYNDATFRIPDQRGYQPYKEPIIYGHFNKDKNNNSSMSPPPLFGSCLKTSINVHQLCHDLNQCISNDSNNSSAVVAATTTTNAANLRGGGGAVTDATTSRTNLSSNNTIVTVSTDPGRFICNFLIYTSLSKYQHTTTSTSTSNNHEDDILSSSSTPSSKPVVPKRLVHSLFVHVPPFNSTKYNCGKDEQFYYIATIMDKLKSCNYFS